MISPSATTVDQVSTTLRQITDATEDRLPTGFEQAQPSNVLRRFDSFSQGSSFEAFSSFGLSSGNSFGRSSTGSFGLSSTGSSFGLPSSGSFSLGSSDSQWNAVNKAKEARNIAGPTTFKLEHSDSFASSFSTLTSDELDDAVEPWAAMADSRFDFGFSDGLRDSCMYHVPREYLPSDEDTDLEPDEDSDTVIESDTEEDRVAFESESDSESDGESVPCGEESEPEEREPSPFTAQDVSPLPASTSLPDSWAPGSPGSINSTFLRRSARVSRLTKRAEDGGALKTPIKRKRPAAKSAPPSPRKKPAFVGRSGKPTARPPSSPSPKRKETGKPKIKRVILRV